MWCLHYIDFKGNYTKDCPTSGRDFKWTVQGKKQKDRFVLASLQPFFCPILPPHKRLLNRAGHAIPIV